jgi:hypothetical protein
MRCAWLLLCIIRNIFDFMTFESKSLRLGDALGDIFNKPSDYLNEKGARVYMSASSFATDKFRS